MPSKEKEICTHNSGIVWIDFKTRDSNRVLHEFCETNGSISSHLMVNFYMENAVLAQPERDFVGQLLRIELTRFVQGSLYKKRDLSHHVFRMNRFGCMCLSVNSNI